MPDDKRSLLSNFHVRKYSEIFLVLLGSEIKHPPLANKTENVSKTITFGKEMSKRLKICFRGSPFTTRRSLLRRDLGASAYFLSVMKREIVTPGKDQD